MSKRNILILFAHPRLDRSIANKRMMQEVRDLPGVTFVDLYATYPRFEIDVRVEQERLTKNDVIIFQHPLYWYSTPSIMKEYQDLVLEYGFAYGSEGQALKDKLFMTATTTGGPKEAYCTQGYQHFPLRQLLTPFEQTAHLCHMIYLPPFVLYSAGHANEEKRLVEHCRKYARLLEALRDDRYDLEKAQSFDTISDQSDQLIRGGN